MAITWRTATVTETATTATGVTGTLPADAETGDLYIAVFSGDSLDTNVTGPSGWTAIVAPVDEPGQNLTSAVYYRWGATSGPAISTSGAAGYWTCIVEAAGGVDTTTPIDVAAVTTIVTSATSVAADGVTTVTDGAVLLSTCAVNTRSRTFSTPSGMTMIAQYSAASQGRACALARETRATAGATGTRTWGFTATPPALSFVAACWALRPATGLTRTPADTATATDAVSAVRGNPRTLADTATASDAPVRVVGVARAVADTGTASDAVARALGAAGAVADTATPSDVPVSSSTRARTAADTATASDTATGERVTLCSASDTATASDTVAVGAAGRPRAAADTMAPGDAPVAATGTARAASDTATTSDGVTHAGARARALADTATASDTAATAGGSTSVVEDAATPSDSADRASGLARAAADTVTVSDSTSTGHGGVCSVADTVPIADTVTAAAAWSGTVEDIVTILDAVTRQAGHQCPAGDSITVADATTRAAQPMSRAVADSGTPSDTASRQWAAARLLVDAVPVSDEGATGDTGRTVHRAVVDVVGPTDAITALYRPRPLGARALRVDTVRRRYVLGAPPVGTEGFDVTDTYYQAGREVRTVTWTDRQGDSMTGLTFTAAVVDHAEVSVTGDPWQPADSVDTTSDGVAVVGVQIGDGCTWDLTAGTWRLWVRAYDGDSYLIRPERRTFDVV